MHQPVIVLLVSLCICFCDSATFETEMLIYRCHSYFRRVTTDGSYQQFVKQYVQKHCDSHLSLSVLMISLDYDDCRVQYLYKPNTWSFYRTDRCANAIYDLRTKGLELAWGHPWGCPAQIFPMRFTKHFDVLVPLRTRKTMDFNRSISTRIEFCGVGKKFTINFVCYMTPFGGYRWRPLHPDECYVPQLDLLTYSLVQSFEHARPRCTAVLPTLFSPVEGQNGDSFTQTPEPFHPLLLLERFCYNLTALGKNSANITYRIIDHIYETIINHRLPGSEKISSEDAVRYLGRLMNVASSIFRTAQERLLEFRNRTRYFTFEKFNLQKYAKLEFNDCGNMKVIFPWGTGSVFVACVPYGEPPRANSFREKQLLLGVTLVQGDLEQNFHVGVEFTLPPPHVFTRYECVWAEKLELRKFRTPHLYDTRAIITGPTDMCFFDRPGYYAVMSVGKFFREEEFNPVRTNRLLWGHLLLILLSLAALVFNLVIDFNSTCMFMYARGAKNLRQIRCYLLLACQILFITACKLMVQLVGIFVPERRYCETVGLFQLGIHAIFHALNLVVSVLVFAIRRSHSPISLMVKFSACAYVFGVLYTGIASFYLKRQFVKLNCMPLQMFKLMAYPFIGISLGSIPFIIRFLCSPPYRHWDEWVGAIIQTMVAIAPWIEAIITRSELSWHGYSEYHFVLLMLIQALVLVVYYGLLKYSILLLIVKGIFRHVKCSRKNRMPTSNKPPGLTHSESDSNSEPRNFISQLLEADQRQRNSRGTDSSATTVSQSRSLSPSINLDIDETGHGAREIEFSTVAFPRSRFMSSMKKMTPTHQSSVQEPSAGWLSAPPEDTDLTLPLVNEVISAERKSLRGRRKTGSMRHSAGRVRYYGKSIG